MFEHAMALSTMTDAEKRDYVSAKIKETETAIYVAKRDLEYLRRIERQLGQAAFREALGHR